MRAATLCTLALLVFFEPAAAQIVTGSIVGNVEDPSGAAVAGALVTATHVATGRERTARTSETGSFVLSGLEAGRYDLGVRSEGFKRVEQRGLMLPTGERLPVGAIVLELGAITETVSVTAAPAAVRTASAENSGVITNDQAEYLPVLGRSVESLVSLLPGVVSPGGAPQSFSGGADYSVLGSRSRSNSISIDGIVVTDADSGGGKRLSVSQDAVAEVKILISNYQAEYGRMSASNLEVVTKSGTRDLHGLASYFKRHEQFNAGHFFDNRLGRSKPIYRYNVYNYNLGGPVTVPGVFNTGRDRAFFFWGQEFWPSSSGLTVMRTMPTELERAGNFSQSLDQGDRLIVIRDPSANQPFPGNIVPASRIDRNGQALLKVFDLPNFFNRSISRGAYNYIHTQTRRTPERTDTLKIDYNLTSNHRVAATYSGYYATTEGYAFGGANSNWPQIKGNYKSPTRTIGTRYTGVLSPSVINEVHVGWLHRDETNEIDPDTLARNQRDKIGYTAGQFSPGINPLNLIPNAAFGGVVSAPTLSFDGRFPYDFFQNLVNIDQKLTVIRGAHTFKAGVYVEYFDRNMPVQGLLFNGEIDFGRSATNPLDTGYAFSNAMLGVYNTYSEASAKPRMHTRSWTTDFFVQDNWKVNSRLTLDIGARIQWLPWIYDRDDLIAGFVREKYDPARRVYLLEPALNAARQRVARHPVTGEFYSAVFIGAIAPGVGDPFNGMVVAARDKSYPRSLSDNPPIRLAPRFGFAYDLSGNGKTALRGGFGQIYNREMMAHSHKWLVAQPPLVLNPILYHGELRNLLASSGLGFPSEVLSRDRALKNEKIMNYSIGIEQNVGFDTIVRTYYVGALGRNLYWRRSVNPVPPGANFNPANADPTRPGNPLPPVFLRPTPGYHDIFYFEGAASSNYHSLQVSATRRFTKGLQFGSAWTWSKAMDYNEDPRAIGAGATISPFVHPRVWDYGPMSWDRTHVFKLNYLWEVPRAPWNNAWSNFVLKGWQVSGITTFQSGRPLGIGLTTTVARDFTGTASHGARVNHVQNAVLPKSERTFSRFFNTNAVAMPQVGTFGNASKVLLRGPGINNWDLAIFKSFPIREPFRLQFRCEMYNAFNHTQFSGVDTTARFDPNGVQVNGRFGELISADPARRMQFGLRFVF